MSKGMKIAVWVVSILLGALFILSGAGKFMDIEPWRGRFAAWGLPGWFVPFVAIAELVGGVLLFVPKLAAYGGSLIVLVMLGACGTHLMSAEWPNAGFTLFLAALAAFVVYQRRPGSA